MLKVGDTVVLSDYGLEELWGTTLGLDFMKQVKMQITNVEDSVNSTTYLVKVSFADLNVFPITNHCFDLVKKGDKAQATPEYQSNSQTQLDLLEKSLPHLRRHKAHLNWLAESGNHEVKREAKKDIVKLSAHIEAIDKLLR